jgi:hypothetical protein
VYPMIAAETAIRAWVNGQSLLVGPGNPLAGGAYLLQQRSPDTGAYAVLARTLPSGGADMVSEDDNPFRCRILALIYHNDQALCELAAAALASAWNDLNGNPSRCGTTGVTILVTDNLQGPMFMPTPADTGEPYCFQVAADFVLMS